MDGVDLKCLLGVFSGGDCLSIELKKKFDRFLQEHGATVQVREGYGTTECVTASCLTPYDMYREGSIGLPFPDTYYKIVKVGTTDELPYGEEGEICLCGPSVMIEYVNQPEETANVLKRHADGHTWLHTGDLGTMDSDGFIYFKQRLKRLIITSGYNVYPSQVENAIDAHEKVLMSCVIGVPDFLPHPEGQGVRCSAAERSAYPRSQGRNPRALPQKRRQIRHAVRYRVPQRTAKDARRQGGLYGAGKRRAGKAGGLAGCPRGSVSAGPRFPFQY